MYKSEIHVLIIGCGGREHAIAKAVSRSKISHQLFCVGNYINPKIEEICKDYAMVENLCDFRYLGLCVSKWQIDLAIIGPEKPLSLGIAEGLKGYHVHTIGPSTNFALLESSKSYCRNLFVKYGMKEYIPDFQFFDDSDADYVKLIKDFSKFASSHNEIVLKCDGLKSGKGVMVQGVDFKTTEDGMNLCKELFKKKESFLVEEKLVGKEFSLMSFCDGFNLKHCPVVCDFKRLYENDLGPNTGSMGSVTYSDHGAPFLTDDDIELARKINENLILYATLENSSITKRILYKGVLYGSFIKTNDGKIKVIEYNVRFGDPEGINILHLLEDDFLDICGRIVNGQLTEDIRFRNEATVLKYCVPMDYASPRSHEEIQSNKVRSNEVRLNEEMFDSENIYVAGVRKENGSCYTTGSRSFALIGKSSNEVNIKLQNLLSDSEDLRYRSDISHISNTPNLDTREQDRRKQTKIDDYFVEKKASLSEQKKNVEDSLKNETFNENKFEGMTYKGSGIDVDEADRTVEKLKEIVGGNNIGPFAGSIEIVPGKFLVSSMDGVGSKTDFVIKHWGTQRGLESLGHDLVNHCVNDLMVGGCMKPVSFLDYFGCDKLRSNDCAYFVKGVKDACDYVGCQLIGGETAEMPTTYKKNNYELVGTINGLVDEESTKPCEFINSKQLISEGSILYGMRSSSPHTNGYTLLNKIYDSDAKFREQFADYCCRPHMLYQPFIKELLDELEHSQVLQGICHITGGGWEGNMKRILPTNVTFELTDYSYDDFPNVYKYLSETYKISTEELMNTFNCGIGLILVVDGEKFTSELAEKYNLVRLGRIINK